MQFSLDFYDDDDDDYIVVQFIYALRHIDTYYNIIIFERRDASVQVPM